RVELDDLDASSVGEISDGRVVERQVPVLTDAEHAHVDGVAAQEPLVPRALRLGVSEPVEVVRGRGRHPVRDALPDPPLEPRGWSGPAPTYSSMWNTVTCGHGTSGATTRMSTNANCELPVANMALALPRSLTVSLSNEATSAAACRASAAGSGWTSTCRRSASGMPYIC